MLLVKLLGYLNKVIANSTNKIILNKKSNIVKLLDYIINKPNNKVQIVTFNYDLQAERALEYLDNIYKNKHILSFPMCYRLPNGSYRNSRPTEKNVRTFTSANSKRTISILKPHGSLNWFCLMPQGKNLLNYFPGSKDTFWVSRRYKLPLNLKLRKKTTFPLIIPPLVNKGVIIKDSVVGHIWKKVLFELKTSHEVIIYGYSMPSADSEAINMFAQALKSSKILKSVVIINPDINVVPRIMPMTNANVGLTFKDVNSYLAYRGGT